MASWARNCDEQFELSVPYPLHWYLFPIGKSARNKRIITAIFPCKQMLGQHWLVKFLGHILLHHLRRLHLICSILLFGISSCRDRIRHRSLLCKRLCIEVILPNVNLWNLETKEVWSCTWIVCQVWLVSNHQRRWGRGNLVLILLPIHLSDVVNHLIVAHLSIVLLCPLLLLLLVWLRLILYRLLIWDLVKIGFRHICSLIIQWGLWSHLFN
jgi:hypothetical protein